MKKTITLAVALFLGIMLGLTGCSGNIAKMVASINNSNVIDGDRNIVKVEKQLSSSTYELNITEMRFQEAGNIILRESDDRKISVSTDNNIMDNINIDIDDVHKKINITSANSNKYKFTEFVIEVSVPVTGVKVGGAFKFDAEIKDMDSFSFTSSGTSDGKFAINNVRKTVFDLKGASDLELSGNTDVFEADISGAGDIKADELKTRECETNISGSGGLKIYTSEILKVNIQGAGKVIYDGNPSKVEKNIMGSGSVKHKYPPPV